MSLYHYTDAHGLMGIIQNKALWATDMGFLNDSKEMFAGISLIKRRCAEILASTSQSNDAVMMATRGLYEYIPIFVWDNLTRRDVYIVSFSRAYDNLRQWMAYCPKNAGYAIEIDEAKILPSEGIDRKKTVVCRLEKVDYDEKHLDNIISIESITKKFERRTTSVEDVSVEIVNDLIFHCCAIKSAEFYDERETRLVIQSQLEKQQKVSFRSRAGLIIPYFEYPIDLSWIKEITIGPNVNMSLARKGLETFLRVHEVDCNVRESACSLRVF
ncbi:DUF2971 domain-containing protein [Pseudomonas asiatica]|uniref:DUF2971 domain-containing protein n=1 Tax=Pseudomonas asiatica TaxID=2219225 RepID=UPI0018A92329|nr:DUF2971 domain-containing protein [Pseudomonas asiatica]MBF8802166.1 DUF2971 domain-containing protein [Pseudomonas asiatica]